MEVSGRTISGSFSKYFFLGSEEDSILYCQPCDRDGPRVPAFGFCKNCAEHLCESCYKNHRKPSPCRKHILLDKTQMPQSPLRKQPLLDKTNVPTSESHITPSVPTDLTEPCQIHKGKLIEYFCCDHKILGCSPCITVSHRNCKVDYIPDVSKNFKTSPDYIYLRHSFHMLKESCKKISDFAKANKIKTQKNQRDVQKGVQKFRKEINDMLDKWEADINQQSYSIFAEENAKIDSIVSASGKLLTDIAKLQDNFKALEKEKKNNALLIQVKAKGRLVKQYKSIVNQMQEKNMINHYTFEPNLAIEKMLKLVTKLGYINLQTRAGHAKIQSPRQKEYLTKLRHRLSRNKWKKLQPIVEEHTPEDEVYEEFDEKDNVEDKVFEENLLEIANEEAHGIDDKAKEIHGELAAKLSGELCVRILKDKVRCRNKAIAVVGNDKIAVADAENHAVKLIDTKSETAVSETELSSRPNGIAFLPDDLLAVALPNECTIQFLSMSNRLSEAYHLKVDGRCTDLAYCPGKLVVTYQNPGKVEIMDEKGQIFKTIQQTVHGASLFDDSRVNIGMDNKSFYISDRFFKTVTCFNWSGKAIFEYNNQSLIRPCGLAALGNGSLLVCNSSNNSIHLISPNLKTDQIILQKDDGLQHPWSIAVDSEQKKTICWKW